MTRQSRMVLIIGVMAVIGVVVLALIANRYAKLAEKKSVKDLQQASAQEEPQAPGSGLPLDRQLEAFAAARSAIQVVLDEFPHSREVLVRDAMGEDVPEADVPSHALVLAKIRFQREKVFEETGLAKADYVRIRDQYRSWRSGEGEILPEWKEAFEAAPELAEKADLGRYDLLDY